MGEHTVASYLEQIEAVEGRARNLVEGLDDAALVRRPETGRWSIAENLQHMNVTLARYLEKLRPAFQALKEGGAQDPGPFSYGWFERWFESSMEPPVKRRFKAPSSFGPAKSIAPDDPQVALETFLAQHRELAELLDGARGLDLTRRKIASPVTSLIRFRVGAAVAIGLAHDRRHLEQAEAVRRELSVEA